MQVIANLEVYDVKHKGDGDYEVSISLQAPNGHHCLSMKGYDVKASGFDEAGQKAIVMAYEYYTKGEE